VLDRSGATLLTLMTAAATVPTMVLAATTDSNHNDDAPHR